MASATVERAQAMGLHAFAIPLFVIQPLDWALPDVTNFDGLLLTSANAVRCAGPKLGRLRHLPMHAVGPATARAAAEAGLAPASTGESGVDDLLHALSPGLRLLHLCGEERHAPGASAHRITPVAVYRSAEVPDPSGLERLSGTVALVHSPRAGRRLAHLAPSRPRTAIAAISRAAAEACGTGWERIAVAERPLDDALLSLGARLCEHSHPA